ncbi:MAG: ATP-dependent Clp protease adaptor ClpS [Chthonomonadaceae bacterium]|nr:ATP-dependent Clp protease adaptor ClpS [Chthonomonadaceae bacterium]
MPTELEIAEPWIHERSFPSLDDERETEFADTYVVILYNDDYHDVDEVALQIQKATGYNKLKAVEIMLEAHLRGRAICYTGSEAECEKVAGVLRQIRLQVETDKF